MQARNPLHVRGMTYADPRLTFLFDSLSVREFQFLSEMSNHFHPKEKSQCSVFSDRIKGAGDYRKYRSKYC